LWARQKLVSAQEGRSEEVDAITREALTIAAKEPGAEFPALASMLHGLAELRNRQTRYPDAEELAQKAVAMHRRLGPKDDLEKAWALLVLGTAFRNDGKLDLAEHALWEAFGIFRKQYAHGHKSIDEATAELRLVLQA